MATSHRFNRPHLVLLFVVTSVLAQALAQIRPIAAAGGGAEPSPASTQPLWSYQVKPTNYVNTQPGGQASGGPLGHYTTTASSIFDAFNGLSQRQGALSGSPFLTILPIILIAAGGLMLLLPFLTMMVASPFGGGAFGGGFNGANGFGYPPQLGKKRSLSGADSSFAGRSHPAGGALDLFEHVSSVLEELARKYSPQTATTSASHKRAKAMNSADSVPGSSMTGNHRPNEADNLNAAAAATAANNANNSNGPSP